MTDELNAENGGEVGKDSGLKSKTEPPLVEAPKVTPAPPPVVAPQPSAPSKPPDKKRPGGNSSRSLFWQLMGQDRPSKSDEKRAAFAKGFQKLWVAGTMGAFFTALVRNLPVHLKQFAWPCDWNYTIDLFVRYGYLLWLLAYFLVSTIGIDNDSYGRAKKDIAYDVGQSACSLTAAFFLGFILPDQPYRLGAYAITNGVICAICFVALLLFHDPPEAPQGVNRLRLAGGVISFLSLALALFIDAPETWVFIMFAGLLFILFLILVAYIRMRIDVST